MSTEDTALMRYRPDIVQIENIGIGLYETNETMSLVPKQQYMVVGERFNQGSPSPSHNLIVDNTGVAINTSLVARSNLSTDYALYVSGDVFVDGTIHGSVVSSGEGSAYFSRTDATRDPYNNIYYAHNVNVANRDFATSNSYKFNITTSPNRDITKAHLSIQNQNKAQLRAGIIGNDRTSPVIFNTSSNVPIEFHVGRDANYFTETYKKTLYTSETITSDFPTYTSPNVAPHMSIDWRGNVGIRTNTTHEYTYIVPRKSANGGISFETNREFMAFSANAPIFARELLIYDYESQTACNIDSLYVRAVGQSIRAEQLVPGSFAPGVFTFQSNVEINGTLRVHDGINASNLFVNGKTYLSEASLCNITVHNIANFTDSVIVNNDLEVANTLRFGTRIQVRDPTNPSGWSDIDFTRSDPSSYSNINEIGMNVTMPGRLAVGFNPLLSSLDMDNDLHQQLNVVKTPAPAGSSIRDDLRYELQLFDRSLEPAIRKVAVIGHTSALSENNNDLKRRDASLIIATGNGREDYFNGVKSSYPNVPQNIYFYPGQYSHSNIYNPLIRADNPPTMGVFESGMVGVGTFQPQKHFHVQGESYFSSDMYSMNPMTNTVDPLAKLFKRNYGIIGAGQFKGIEYTDSTAPHIGLNSQPEANFGLVVRGSIKVYDDMFTSTNERIGHWLKPTSSDVLFTNKSVGVGVVDPESALDVTEIRRDRYTYVTIRANTIGLGDETTVGGVQFITGSQKWKIESGVPTADGSIKEFAIFNDQRISTQNSLITGSYHVAQQKHILNIGESLSNHIDFSTSSTLNVGGDVHISGDLKISKNLDIRGNLKIGGCNVSINSDYVATLIPSQIDPNDVLIGGKTIHLLPKAPNPTSTSTLRPDPARDAYVSVGYTNETQDEINKSLEVENSFPILRVHQYITSDSIARFSSKVDQGYLDIWTRSGGQKMRFGVETVNGQPSLVFKESGGSEKYFLKVRTNPARITSKLAGFNVPVTVGNEPTANLHVFNDSTGDQMMLLQQSMTSDSFINQEAPSMTFDKRVGSSPIVSERHSTQFTIKGPISSDVFNSKQRIAFQFGHSNVIEREVLSITSDGAIGIGTTMPVYAIDIHCTRPTDAIRLNNPSNNSAPQLIFQSGSNVYGRDQQTDYRFVASNMNFGLEQENSTLGLIQLLHFNENGNLGIHTNAKAPYAVDIQGALNVTDAILLNGSPFIFRRDNSNVLTGISVDDIGSIYINPPATDPQYGGVVINGANSEATSNLFHVFGGANANMMVLDSSFNEAQIHFRTKQSAQNKTFKLGASNGFFNLEYNPQHSEQLYIDGSHIGYSNVVQWFHTPSNKFMMDLHGDLRLPSSSPSIHLGLSQFQSTTNGNLAIITPGNIGVGTYTTTAKMHIFNDQDRAAFIVHNQSSKPQAMFLGTSAQEVVVISDKGALGIGTTMPMGSLTVEGTSYTRNILPLSPTNQLGSNTNPWHSAHVSSHVSIGNLVNKFTPAPKRLTMTQFANGVNVSEFDKIIIQSYIGLGYYPIVQKVSESQLGLFGLVSSEGTPLFTLNGDTLGLFGQTVSFQLSILGIPRPNPILLLSTASEDRLVVGDSAGSLGAFQAKKIVVGDLDTTATEISIERSKVESGLIDLVASNVFLGVELARLRPVVYTPGQNKVGFGTTDPQAAFHLEIASYFEGESLIIRAQNTSNILSVFDKYDSRVFDVSSDGTLGLGSNAIPTTQVNVVGSNSSTHSAVDIHQLNEGHILRIYAPDRQVMDIENNGNIGIGTTSPSCALHVEGDIFSSGTIVASNLIVQNIKTTDVEITYSEQLNITNSGDGPALKVVQRGQAPIVEFYDRLDGTNVELAFVITDGGNVGIGTATPKNMLHVNGTIQAEKVLFRNHYPSLTVLETSVPATSNMGMFSTTIDEVTNTSVPFYSSGLDWERIAKLTEVIEQIETRKGLNFSITDTSIQGNGLCNIVWSGNGIHSRNSSNTLLTLNKGFTYKITNDSDEPIEFLRRTTGIKSLELQSVGSGYSNPVVLFDGGNGEDASATARIDGSIVRTFVVNSGYNHVSPSISASDRETGANVSPQISLKPYINGSVQPFVHELLENDDEFSSTIKLNKTGYGLSNVIVYFDFDSLPNDEGSNVSAYATLRGSLCNIHVTNGGDGYSNIHVSITDPYGSGSGATAVALIEGGICNVDLLTSGMGYSNPTLTYSSPEGNTTYKGHPILSAEIVDVVVTNEGMGYSNVKIEVVDDYNSFENRVVFEPIVKGGISNVSLLELGGAGYSNPIIQVQYNDEGTDVLLEPVLAGVIDHIVLTNNTSIDNSNVQFLVDDTINFIGDTKDGRILGVYVYDGGAGYQEGETLEFQFDEISQENTRNSSPQIFPLTLGKSGEFDSLENDASGSVKKRVYPIEDSANHFIRTPNFTITYKNSSQGTGTSGIGLKAFAVIKGKIGNLKALPSLQTVKGDISSNINFGKTLDMSYDGNRIVVGASGDPSNNAYNGNKAYIYDFNPSTASWSHETLVAYDTFQYNDLYGFSVALSGNGKVAIVSSPLKDNDDLTDVGMIDVYERTNDGEWPRSGFMSSIVQSNSQFGFSVDVDYHGSTILVGRPLYDSNEAYDSGLVSILKKSLDWGEAQTLSNVSESNLFGYSVSISGNGNTIVVGSVGVSSNEIGAYVGNAFVYTRANDTSDYTPYVTLEPMDSVHSHMYFGESVSIDHTGNVIIVGSRSNQAYIYNHSNEQYRATVIHPPYDINSSFGSVVKLSPDGHTAFIQELDGVASRSNEGKVHIYKFNNSNMSWSHAYYIESSNVTPYDNFGASIASSYNAHRVSVGAVEKLIDGTFNLNSNHVVNIHDFGIYNQSPNVVVDKSLTPSDLEAFVTIQGNICNVEIINPGYNVTKTPTTFVRDTFSSSSNAEIYPMRIGSLSNVKVTSGGMGYSNNISLSIYEDSSLEPSIVATGYANVRGFISAIDTYDVGSGYTTHPSFEIVETTSTIPTNEALVNPHIVGALHSISVTNHGVGYSNVIISLVNGWTEPYTSEAKVYPEVRGSLHSIELIDGGEYYTTPPNVSFFDSNVDTINSYELPEAEAFVVGPIYKFDIITPGSGFNKPPIISISDNNSKRNTIINKYGLSLGLSDDVAILDALNAKAYVDVEGSISSISLTNTGKNFAELPNISIYESSNGIDNYSASVTCNIGEVFIGIDIGMRHETPASNIPSRWYQAGNGETVNFEVPMDALMGSNYIYRSSNNPSVLGHIVIEDYNKSTHSKWETNEDGVYIMGSNVGIGISQPAHPLHVEGKVVATGGWGGTGSLAKSLGGLITSFVIECMSPWEDQTVGPSAGIRMPFGGKVLFVTSCCDEFNSPSPFNASFQMKKNDILSGSGYEVNASSLEGKTFKFDLNPFLFNAGDRIKWQCTSSDIPQGTDPYYPGARRIFVTIAYWVQYN